MEGAKIAEDECNNNINMKPGPGKRTETYVMGGRQDFINSPEAWLANKREGDGIDPSLWRIHDKLYDLSSFAKRHPGGTMWIESTIGTDITEAFEVSHFFSRDTRDALLKKHYVCECPAEVERKSAFTFYEDGFYKTLKRKAVPVLREAGGIGPTRKMLHIQDSLVGLYHVLFAATILTQSYLVAAITGVVLGMNTSCAHNFFHQADNWRRFYWDLSVLGSHKWRITHALSHHLFPNTYMDYEISAFDPFLEFLVTRKNFVHKWMAPVFYHIGLLCLPLVEFKDKLLGAIVLRRFPPAEEAISLVHLALLVHFSDRWYHGVAFFLLMQGFCTYWLAFTSLITTHHHPLIYHAGDYKHPETKDWGIHQVDTVRDVKKTPNLFLVATTFGNHVLHHLFPTVDHSKLDLLWPAFSETCLEFGINYHFMGAADMLRGMHLQLMRETPTTFEERESLRCSKKNR